MTPRPGSTGYRPFGTFAEFEGRTQSQLHIRPLHEYVTCRLVLEGGFHPNELNPRPPLRVEQADERHRLSYAPETGTVTEATILGGLKTKNVDIVATKEGIGPGFLAVSCKGMTGAVRKPDKSPRRNHWRVHQHPYRVPYARVRLLLSHVEPIEKVGAGCTYRCRDRQQGKTR